jgi:hypothetical protein
MADYDRSEEDYGMQLLAAREAAQQYESQYKNSPEVLNAIRKQVAEEARGADMMPGTVKGDEYVRTKLRNIQHQLATANYQNMMADRAAKRLRDQEEMRQLALTRARKEMMGFQE